MGLSAPMAENERSNYKQLLLSVVKWNIGITTLWHCEWVQCLWRSHPLQLS